MVWVAWAAFDPMNTTFAERLVVVGLAGPVDHRVAARARSCGSPGSTPSSAACNREQRASQAVAEERNRIARELHDVIGHSVSVMTVQASAVRRRLTPEQAAERQALETVETVGREALAEMRRMVGVLRDSPATATELRAAAGARPGRPAGREVPRRRAAGRALGDRGGA